MDTGPRSYTATLRRLEGLGRLGVRFGLERMMVDASGDWGPSDPGTHGTPASRIARASGW